MKANEINLTNLPTIQLKLAKNNKKKESSAYIKPLNLPRENKNKKPNPLLAIIRMAAISQVISINKSGKQENYQAQRNRFV